MSTASNSYLASKNLRVQAKDEVIFDIDDRTEHGKKCFYETCFRLVHEAGYHVELWGAEGNKNPHIHLKAIPHIADLSLEEGKHYRLLMFERYIPREFWRTEKKSSDEGAIPDYSLANPYEDAYHPIAEENKPHYKGYGVKVLIADFNSNRANFCEKDLFLQSQALAQRHTIARDNLTQGKVYSATLAGKIASKVSILSIADSFGLSPSGKRMRECPFHADSTPSLSLDAERGLFNCFGCHSSGNIIKFYALLKELKRGFSLGAKK